LGRRGRNLEAGTAAKARRQQEITSKECFAPAGVDSALGVSWTH